MNIEQEGPLNEVQRVSCSLGQESAHGTAQGLLCPNNQEDASGEASQDKVDEYVYDPDPKADYGKGKKRDIGEAEWAYGEYLTQEQKAEWWMAFESMIADLSKEEHEGLIVQLCDDSKHSCECMTAIYAESESTETEE